MNRHHDYYKPKDSAPPILALQGKILLRVFHVIDRSTNSPQMYPVFCFGRMLDVMNGSVIQVRRTFGEKEETAFLVRKKMFRLFSISSYFFFIFLFKVC
jgi:hypothetical protein